MPRVLCPVCGETTISLDPFTYWNTGEEGVLITCPNCKSRLRIWLEGGELKKIEIVEEKKA